MSTGAGTDPDYADWGVDALIDKGADFESLLQQCKRDLDLQDAFLRKEASGARKRWFKLAAELIVGIGGLIAAPVTGGLSLLLSFGAIALMVWDVIELGPPLLDYQSRRREAVRLRAKAETLTNELERIWRALSKKT